ncbi:MAG: primosomal protein N' [Alphaproteobacteria bacterium]|nr:primosomal protein N' [Alphaproteobacteria bacterium]
MTTPHAKPNTNKAQKTVRVLLPLPVGSGYDYIVPPDLSIKIGSFVSVPFGKKEVLGIVWAEGSGEVPASKLKALNRPLDLEPLPEVTRAFVDWVAGYTLTPPGSILKMVLGGQLRPLKDKDKLDFPQPDPALLTGNLTEEQTRAAEALCADVQEAAYAVTLLDGVTGSGKTEVYAQALAQCFRQGRQALLLLPEIAMTAALLGRLEKHFGAPPTLWHSGLTEKQRRLNWHAIKQGKAKFILGARSALFLPYADLGLIVVDEEHEGAYKQEEGVIYHGRDMAVVRAHLGKIPLILASATPSLETHHNVKQGKYKHLILHSRFGAAKMPQIELVDLRAEKMSAQTFISQPLFDALEKALAAKQQAMLFLNRRGYAPLTLCRACGNRLQCPSCTAWLIEHKKTSRLHCHQCGYSTKIPSACPVCNAEDKFAACGPGIERIAEEVAARLPTARAAIMASDTLDSAKGAAELVEQMDNHAIDILIGTQIMAKGYHFPRLTLVGVIDADLGLAGGDPRAAERTFQLLQQVAGRSGRAEDEGTVFLQTTQPDHPVMQALAKGQRDAFMQTEMRERQAFHLPPFARLASLTISGADRTQVVVAAQKIAAAAPQTERMRILGPAPAPYAILRGKTRYRLTIQAARNVNLSAAVAAWLAPLSLPRTLKVQVDIDPYSFL